MLLTSFVYEFLVMVVFRVYKGPSILLGYYDKNIELI